MLLCQIFRGMAGLRPLFGRLDFGGRGEEDPEVGKQGRVRLQDRSRGGGSLEGGHADFEGVLAWVRGGRGWLQAQIHLLLGKLPAWGVTTHPDLQVRDL